LEILAMKMMRSSAVLAAVSFVVLLLSQASASATEVLNNGGLELSTGPYAWTLTQSITGMPGAPISASEQLDAAQEWVTNPLDTPGLGLFLKPQSGNEGDYQDQNKAVNVSLTQTVNFGASAAGRTYTFTAHSFVQAAASNILTTLYPDSPSGAIASPTQTYFELAFLNSSNAVLGTPATVDLRADPTTEAWRSQFVSATAPAGTTKIRVSAVANNMVASCVSSCPAGQDVYFDNFTLRDGNVPTLERLAPNLPDAATSGYSGNLNSIAAPTFWSIEKTSQDNIQFSSASYARNTNNPASNIGMWLRSFAGGDAKILQTVPAAAGGQYTFSAFSKWETGYASGNPFPPTGQPRTSTFLTMEFLDNANAVIGTQTLDLCQDPGTSGCTLQQNDGVWRQFSFNATAPAGTVNVRVSAGAANMYNTAVNPQSAMFDDFSLTTVSVGVPGDYNGNGIVDAADYVLWRKGGPLQNEVDTPGTVNSADYTAWRARFGNISGSGSGNLLAAAVPEPATYGLAMLGLAIGMGIRRRWPRSFSGT
jgi:hypothetical protein